MERQTYSSNPAVNSLLETILQCSQEISELVENTAVHKAGSTNVFGDEQLHLDVDSDKIIEKVHRWQT